MISDKIIEIIKPAISPDGTILLETMERLLEESDYNILKETGINTIKEVVEQLEEDFELLEKDNDLIVKCINYNPIKEKEENIINTTPSSEESADTTRLNAKIGDVIRELLKDSNSDGYVLLPKLGIELNNKKIKLPGSAKLGAYLRKYPNLFEVINTGTDAAVRNVADNKESFKTPTNSKPMTSIHNGFVSMYNIFDFAYFQDYKSFKAELSKIAVQESWFVLPNPLEKDPYLIIDYKIRSNFALIVNKQLQEGGDWFVMQPDKAKFYTGFTSVDGDKIMANFKFNQQRDATRWQNWIFDHISLE